MIDEYIIGDILINGEDAIKWGLNLEEGALSALMTPPPMKDFIESRSRLQSGSRVITKSPRYDSRTISLPFHIVAKTKEDFFNKYAAFCDDVLSKGAFTLETRYQQRRTIIDNGKEITIPPVVYHLVYVSCTQFSQYQREMAKFTLKVIEPNPNDRVGKQTETPHNIPQTDNNEYHNYAKDSELVGTFEQIV